MRSRGLVVAIAVVLAVLAAVGVIVYTNSVKNGTGADTTAVIVSNQDIPANTPLNPLIDSGAFGAVNVPNDTLVSGAVTDENELRDQTTSSTIYANEQIPTSRLATGRGNTLGISEGHVGLGIQVDGPQSVNGYIQNNDQVVIYATFPQGETVTKQDLKHLLAPAQLQRFLTALQTGTTANAPVITMPFDFTLPLVRSVRVLAITNPPVDSTTGKPGERRFVTGARHASGRCSGARAGQHRGDATVARPASPEQGRTTPSAGYKSPANFGVPFAKVTGVGAP